MASSKNLMHRAFGLDAEQHGKHEAVAQSDAVNLQVINFGLSRTGTTSVDLALEELGFGPGHQGVVLYRYREQNDAFTALFDDFINGRAGSAEDRGARVRKLTRGYRSAGDGPMNCMVEESLAAYPDAKFILSTRDGGEESWWKSISDTMGVFFSDKFERFVFMTLTYSVGFIRRQYVQTQKYRAKIETDLGIPFGPEIYTRHNDRVRRLVPKDRLLEYNVREGWDPLCKFLGVPVPDRPFPKVNDTAAMKRIFFGMQAFGAVVWSFYLVGLGGALYFAFSPSLVRRMIEAASNGLSSVQRRLG